MPSSAHSARSSRTSDRSACGRGRCGTAGLESCGANRIAHAWHAHMQRRALRARRRAGGPRRSVRHRSRSGRRHLGSRLRDVRRERAERDHGGASRRMRIWTSGGSVGRHGTADLDRVDLAAPRPRSRDGSRPRRHRADIAPPPSALVAWTTATPSRMPVEDELVLGQRRAATGRCASAPNDPFLGGSGCSPCSTSRLASSSSSHSSSSSCAGSHRHRGAWASARARPPAYSATTRRSSCSTRCHAGNGASSRTSASRSFDLVRTPRAARLPRRSRRSASADGANRTTRPGPRLVAATGNTCERRVDLARVAR